MAPSPWNFFLIPHLRANRFGLRAGPARYADHTSTGNLPERGQVEVVEDESGTEQPDVDMPRRDQVSARAPFAVVDRDIHRVPWTHVLRHGPDYPVVGVLLHNVREPSGVLLTAKTGVKRYVGIWRWWRTNPE